MGKGFSRKKAPQIPIPQYMPPAYSSSSSNTSSSTNFPNVSSEGFSALGQRQQKPNDVYRIVQNPRNQTRPIQATNRQDILSSLNNDPPVIDPSTIKPLFQRAFGSDPLGISGFRATDYAAVANIAGINPEDVTLLHREFLNLTKGGTSKIDRVVFRQLLRDVLIDANNENIDRTIENIFIAIDRNRDGFIDFPEFVGAFRDVLKGDQLNSQNYVAPNTSLNLTNEQILGNTVNSSFVHQPITYAQQPQSLGQIISIPSTNVQQPSLVYNDSNPLGIPIVSNQSPYVVSTEVQPIVAQPAPLQYVPLSI